MEMMTVIGIAASILTMVSMLPQVIHILKTKRSETISWWVPTMLIAGTGLWIWYGVLKNDWIIIVSNGVSVFLNILVLGLSMYYKNKKIGY